MRSKIQLNLSNIKVSWQLVSVILALGFGVVGFGATSVLLRLPTNPSCNRISLFFSSATNRIYCAQLEAEKNTVDDLLNAIALLQVLPPDHPLSNEINRFTTQWSEDILTLADEQFNGGNLEEAIAIARRIPSTVASYDLVEDKISSWTEIWQQGEKIKEDVEKELRNSQWNRAFLTAVNLLNVKNEYWQTTKYQEIVKTINLAREESKQLDGAYITLRRGGLENYLETITIASVISASSYSYNEARQLIEKAEEGINALAEEYLTSRNWDGLADLAGKIPDVSNLKKTAEDWKILASAGKNANLSTVSGMELAIAEVEQIASDSPVYVKSRELLSGWSNQKEDLTRLASARDLAKSGDIESLQSAIGLAELIKQDNELYREARREISQWTREIQTIEDRPIIATAQELAMGNNVDAWKSAINEARKIAPNRALSSEATDLIRGWQSQIEIVEDRPTLDNAIALGNSNNYQEAINVASRIGRGRALHQEAQTNIRRWRGEITAQQDLQRAYQIAQNNDHQSLSQAINIARRIPANSSVSVQSRQAVNMWSEQILLVARRTADVYSPPTLENAISIARMIPRESSVYSTAQQQISRWQNFLSNPNTNQDPLIRESSSF